MIIGTAGHIDHGKTSLVKALTGVDADRLAEEKRRGITIDLGYAYGETDDGQLLGFVDVPGHERFVHNMLAGATGIDHALLVIAADDGVMPQTREHLSVLELLAVSSGTVVLTKIDRVESARLQQVREQVGDLVAQSFLRAAKVFEVSNSTGAGIEALRQHLGTVGRNSDHLETDRFESGQLEPSQLESGQLESNHGFRLAIDRVFTLTGIGTIATGTVHAGQVSVGDTLKLMPRGLEVRVRGLHAQNRVATRARRGDRCALNLAGDGFERSLAQRGAWLTSGWLQRGSDRFDARLQVLAQASHPIRSWMPAHLHLGTADVMCRLLPLSGEQIEPGAQGWVQVVCDSEIHVCVGDRFVLRDQGASQTLAGGVVLDTVAPVRKRRTESRLRQLQALSQAAIDDRLAALVNQSDAAVALKPLAAQWNVPQQGLLGIARSRSEFVCLASNSDSDAWMVWQGDRWQSLQRQVLAALAAFHQQFPDELGCERDRLRRIALPQIERGAGRMLVHSLIEQSVIAASGVWLHLPSHVVTLSASERAFREQVLRMLAVTPLEPPWVRDIAQATSHDEKLVRGYMLRLVRHGDVFQVVKDLFFDQAAIERLKLIALTLQRTEGSVTAARFRDQSGLSRKRAIQVLEYFDRIGLARRVRDVHYFREAHLI